MYGAILGDIIGSPYEFDRGISMVYLHKSTGFRKKSGAFLSSGEILPYQISFIMNLGAAVGAGAIALHMANL